MYRILFLVFCFLISVPISASLIQDPNIKILHGKFTARYFLTNGHQGTTELGQSFVYVFDRTGKIVWEYFSTHNPYSKDIRTRSLVVKPTGSGQYGILHPYEASFFELIDKKKKVLMSRDFRLSKEPTVFHHDFIFRNGKKILSFGNSRHFYRKWWKFWAAKNSFLGSPIIEFDFASNSPGVLWDYLKNANPFRENDWVFSAQDSGAFFQSWYENRVENDFEHANSIEEIPGKGFLLSLRSQNKLMFLDGNSKEILWTLGPSRRNTFSTQQTEFEFYRQHHASFLKDGNLMLFDNGISRSRILILQINEKTRQARRVKEFVPHPMIHSEKHGSAFELENGNVLGFFPSTKPNQNSPNYLIEFDRNSGKELARMSLDVGVNRVGYRAIPLNEY